MFTYRHSLHLGCGAIGQSDDGIIRVHVDDGQCSVSVCDRVQHVLGVLMRRIRREGNRLLSDPGLMVIGKSNSKEHSQEKWLI